MDSQTDQQSDASKTLAKQSSITFAGDVFKKLFGFLIVAAITRLVSPGLYGLFVLATSIVLLVQTLAGLGLPKAVDYFVPQYLRDGDIESARAAVVTIMLSVVALSTLVAILLLQVRTDIAELFAEPGLGVALLFLAITLPMLAVYRVAIATFGAVKQLQYRVYTRNVIRPVVRFVVTVALLVAGYGLLGLLIGYIVGLFVAMAVGLLLLLKNFPELVGWPERFADPRPLVVYSAPLAVAGLIYVILGQIDYFVLGIIATADDVGIYRVGYMLAANILIFFTAVAPVFKPLIAEVKSQDGQVEQRYRTAVRWVAALSIPVMVTLSVGASAYLSVLFTQQYSVAAPAVAILSVGYLVSVTCGGPDGTLLQGLGYSRLVFLNTTLLLGSNLLLSILLVPLLGITGAAIATATALSLTGIANVTEVYVFRGIHPFTPALGKLFLSGIPAAIAAGAVVTLFSDVVVAAGLPVVVFGVYIGSLIITDAITEEDVEIASEFGGTAERLVRAASD